MATHRVGLPSDQTPSLLELPIAMPVGNRGGDTEYDGARLDRRQKRLRASDRTPNIVSGSMALNGRY